MRKALPKVLLKELRLLMIQMLPSMHLVMLSATNAKGRAIGKQSVHQSQRSNDHAISAADGDTMRRIAQARARERMAKRRMEANAGVMAKEIGVKAAKEIGAKAANVGVAQVGEKETEARELSRDRL